VKVEALMFSDSRLEAVFHSAVILFIRKGYRQTQISDIAKDSGLATGSIYNLFTGKKALFQCVLREIFDASYGSSSLELPVSETDADEFQQFIEGQINRVFSAVFEEKNTLAFPDKLALLYDTIARYGAGFLIFERNSVEWGPLCAVYYHHRAIMLRTFEKTFADYIASGEVRPLDNPEYHARLIIETLSFWGMHVPYDITDISVDQVVAKHIVIDSLTHAYKSE
jgi:Bacterial regulatory proteins, tetR family.